MATIFEGASCKAVSIINPYLTPLQLICLGKKLQVLGNLKMDRERAQDRLDDFTKALRNLMYGGEV